MDGLWVHQFHAQSFIIVVKAPQTVTVQKMSYTYYISYIYQNALLSNFIMDGHAQTMNPDQHSEYK